MRLPKYFLVQDLLFKSKIRAAAAAQVATISFFSSAAQLLAAVQQRSPGLICIDLNDQRVQPLAAITELKKLPLDAELQIVGYLSHVDREVAQNAKSAGCDAVMPRSEFVKILPRLLQS